MGGTTFAGKSSAVSFLTLLREGMAGWFLEISKMLVLFTASTVGPSEMCHYKQRERKETQGRC